MTKIKEKKVYLTEEGLRAIQEELDYLRGEGRADIARKIGEAKADGDIAENAGYDEAKNQQAFLEGRILELEGKLKFAEVIRNHDTPAESVELGRSVTIREVGFSDEETYLLVGSAEANPTNGRISNESPIGAALIGKRVGDKASYRSPGGEALVFEIIRIE